MSHPLTDRNLLRLTSAAAEKHFQKLMNFPEVKDYDVRKTCLIWTAATLLAGREVKCGLQFLQLQGGSASWRVVSRDQDDGVSPTHYSYVYTPPDDPDEPAEVHYWCAVHPKHDPRGKGLIADLTTKHVPDLAKEAGLKVSCWPPNEVWAAPDKLPPNCTEYDADVEATIRGAWLLQSLLGVKA